MEKKINMRINLLFSAHEMCMVIFRYDVIAMLQNSSENSIKRCDCYAQVGHRRVNKQNK